MKTDVRLKKIKEALTRGVGKIYPGEDSLKKVLLAGKKIKLYCGYDPTAPTLHLGHMITLKKLAQFQELGHEVIMLIGDFTGMIGDPTEKIASRKKLSRREVLQNSKNYKKLASKVLKFSGPNPVRILYNSDWLAKLTFADLIELASNFTVQQMIVRDMFQERIKKKKPIYLHEFLYPLAQAYDSYAMSVDLEVGGKDQTFNMLCGRELMKILGKREKFVLAMELLTDQSGKKMGKTEGNLVSLDEEPKEMYGRIMAWPDSLLEPGLELLTDVPMEKTKEISKRIKLKKLNPRDAKARLAREVITICHSQESALLAEKEFNKVYRERSLPSRIPEFRLKEKTLPILDILVKTKLTPSKSEAKRLVSQRGVKVDGKIQEDWKKLIEIKKGMIIQVGKRRFLKTV